MIIFINSAVIDMTIKVRTLRERRPPGFRFSAHGLSFIICLTRTCTRHTCTYMHTAELIPPNLPKNLIISFNIKTYIFDVEFLNFFDFKLLVLNFWSSIFWNFFQFFWNFLNFFELFSKLSLTELNSSWKISPGRGVQLDFPP